MRTLLVSALALGAMTSITPAALAAEPVGPAAAPAGLIMLTEVQMDRVTAGSGSSGDCSSSCDDGSLIDASGTSVTLIDASGTSVSVGDVTVGVINKEDDCGKCY